MLEVVSVEEIIRTWEDSFEVNEATGNVYSGPMEWHLEHCQTCLMALKNGKMETKSMRITVGIQV